MSPNYLIHFPPTKWKKESEVTKSCLTLCEHMECSPPGSSIHGIFQARVLEWIAISFCRGSSWTRDWTQVSCIAGRRFTFWATRELHKVDLKLLEDHSILGHIPENFHPTSFSQCSLSSPQFCSFQSETPVFRLWERTEYVCPCSTWGCLLSFWRLAVVCSRAPEHSYIYSSWGGHTLMIYELSK